MLSATSNSLRLFACQKGIFSCVRTLYGSARLGVDAYIEKYDRQTRQMVDSREDFYQRMESFAESPGHMFTLVDLNQMMYMATGEERDQTLLQRMVIRYHGESSGLRFNRFVLGPVMMRMYWHLKLADRALETFNDPALGGFFDQLSSFVLLQDLLYKQGRYEDVLSTMETVMQRQVQGARHPVDCLVLTMASCYQLNTAASYEYCRSLLGRLSVVGHLLSGRGAAFVVALMFRRGEPHEALRLLQQRIDTDRAMLRDLKAMAFSELGRPARAVETLQQLLLLDQPQHLRDATSVTRDAMDSVEAAVQKKNDAEVTSKWQKVKQGLESYGLVKGLSLDEVLTREIVYRRKKHPYRAPSPHEVAFFNRGRRPVRAVVRPGLTDMD